MDHGSFADLLGPRGPLQGRMEEVESRASQIRMAEEVDAVFREGGRLLVEAGPGTGKTFAYLLPALLRARAPEFRVVVSTWTRNLQEQIVDKDLPLWRAALGSTVPVALVQGRENYICRRRLDQAVGRVETLLGSGERHSELQRISDWAGHSRQGTRSELGFRPRPEVWSGVRAERGNCLAQRSPYFRSCAWQWSRRSAREACILVVNHALLMADLKLRREGSSVLPPYQALVIDEAHHLEEVAAEHLGLQVRRRALYGFLGALERDQASGADRGTLLQLVHRCRDLTSLLFDEIAHWVGRRGTAELRGKEGFSDDLVRALLLLCHALRDRSSRATSESEAVETSTRADRLEQTATDLEQVLTADGHDEVYWAESVDTAGDVVLRSAPVDPAPILREELFEPRFATVLTSATLTTPRADGGDGFEYLRHSTGVDDARGVVLPSPFDYGRQARLVLDRLPDPRDGDAYLEALVERIPVHVRDSQGRAFVLFTSRRTMEQVAERVVATLERAGLNLLVQGQGASRRELLSSFRSRQPAVLFGLASFWEGVDVPGEELSHVILTRLPFPVPGHPRDEALGRRLRARGRDPFRELSLPQAVLRFKQGFGRLIRTREDTGRVTVLDSRILSRGYGRLFLEALPDCPRVLWQGGEEIPLPPRDVA